jgi:hypothetical protein
VPRVFAVNRERTGRELVAVEVFLSRIALAKSGIISLCLSWVMGIIVWSLLFCN